MKARGRAERHGDSFILSILSLVKGSTIGGAVSGEDGQLEKWLYGWLLQGAATCRTVLGYTWWQGLQRTSLKYSNFVFATIHILVQGISEGARNTFEERQYRHPFQALLASCSEGCCVHVHIGPSLVQCSKSYTAITLMFPAVSFFSLNGRKCSYRNLGISAVLFFASSSFFQARDLCESADDWAHR